MLFSWKHTESGKETIVELPIKIKKSVSSDYGFGGNLICNNCSNQLKQSYNCSNCGESLTIGQIEKRMDKNTGIIYTEKDKKTFMEIKVDNNIRVEKEISTKDVIDELLLVDNQYEIYNNEDDRTQGLIKQIHNFLYQKDLVLLVSFGYLGKELGGIVVSTKDRLSLITLRDYTLIKEKLQLGLIPRKSKFEKEFNAVSSSNIPILYAEFLKTVKENKPIIKVEREEKKPKTIAVDFLEGF